MKKGVTNDVASFQLTAHLLETQNPQQSKMGQTGDFQGNACASTIHGSIVA